MPSRSACPSGSIRLGWQSTWLSARRRGTSSCGTRPVSVTPSRPSSCARSGPSPTNVSVPSPSRANASASRTTFLRSSSAPTQRKRGGPSGAGGDREALEIDAARHDLRLAARRGDLRLELAPQIVRHADDRRRAPHDEPRRGGDARQLADVAHVAPVRGDDERRARAERGDQPARHEEVRVDDVGPRGAQRSARELEVAELPARPRVEDGALDDVAAVDERVLDLRDEGAEIRRIRRRDTSARRGGSARGQRMLAGRGRGRRSRGADEGLSRARARGRAARVAAQPRQPQVARGARRRRRSRSRSRRARSSASSGRTAPARRRR